MSGDDQSISSYCKIPMSIIEKYGDDIPFDIYLKLSDTKVVKVRKTEGPIKEIVEKYARKGIQSIYTEKSSFISFLNLMKQNMTNKFFDSRTAEQKVESLSDGYEMVKESLDKIGLTDDVAAIAEIITKKSIRLIHEQPNVFKFFRSFKDKCNNAYLKNTLVSYTLTSMLKSADWSSKAILEKMNLAVMLRDITLNEDDFKYFEPDCFEAIPEHILHHGEKVATMIDGPMNHTIPKEVAVIIRQHHEKPDKTGFPLGIGYAKITILSTFHIVADSFITLMIRCDFDASRKVDIFSDLGEMYHQGDFKKAMKALDAIFK
jgi:hypothetical protein